MAKIREGKFIDLGDLLPEALEWAFERSTEDRKEEGKKKRFPVTSIADWTLSFATFMAVAVHFSPQRAVPLATYMAIVARLAREVPGDCWLRYDRSFRQAAAVNPALPWDRREPDVWLAAMVERSAPGSGGMVATPRAQPPPATVPAFPVLRPQGVLAAPDRGLPRDMQVPPRVQPLHGPRPCGQGVPQTARPLAGRLGQPQTFRAGRGQLARIL